ncbi:regulator of microtubule dynamics protein 3 [Gymnogyps californianus]|uniref:regulator of microtubule dynamics protein 3 n=1 Tax=Gymnogyps californianus TaxID=33616 RepID=UPI0021C9DC07|nr:regulator of microtubule dynamics protein 3 [Gymnogyps californianus]XP_050753085.1 regulator of microtubule dynamics protein 3 [Gymnogyps californianus]
MARPGPGRLALGLGLALGAGLGLLWVLRRRRRRGGRRRGGSGGQAEEEEEEEEEAAAGRRSQVVPRVLVPVEAGDGATYAPLPTHDEQVDVLERLDFVLRNISELRKEVEELRNSLQHLATEIIGEVRSHLEETQKVTRRRRFPFPRERSDSTGSSSIYFTASSGTANTDDGESEGGYTTANAESDYDRESERESEEGEDEVSCETVRTARRDSLDLVNEDETHLILDSSLEEGLGQLLQQADRLHNGDEQEKREGFQLLLNNKLAYADQKDFLWRLARAHSDMCEITEDTDERRSYASDGKEEIEIALQKWDQSAECHQWYAILCGQLSEHESIQKRIQTGYVFKEHIDKAIELKPEDPKSYYLLGRWCYQVSHLGWLEKKTASALFEAPPTATVQDALQNFLRVEELSPGFSKAGRVYIAKCYRDLGNNSAAVLWMDLASELPVNTKEDAESERELEEMRSVWEE